MGSSRPQDHLACENVAVTIHLDVLPENQRIILPALGTFATSCGFYLGGGTAVALHLGHRRSVDFDWFSAERLEDPLLLAEQARQRGLDVTEVQVAPGTFHAIISGVRVSFFEYPYPLLGDTVPMEHYDVRLASLDDLACMKLAAVAQRGSRKDFIDLYYIALQHKPLLQLLDLYQRKYKTTDIAHLLMGLVYFEDAEEEPPPLMLRDISWSDVKHQFEEWTRSIAG